MGDLGLTTNDLAMIGSSEAIMAGSTYWSAARATGGLKTLAGTAAGLTAAGTTLISSGLIYAGEYGGEALKSNLEGAGGRLSLIHI